ncbi:MAG: cyclic nucleotide-binding domain-containing protein [Elusimicrobia bacterium]|nr:cyclic nucleotide-binding domain-containing protein [Elusimicrobiota bacterium]
MAEPAGNSFYDLFSPSGRAALAAAAETRRFAPGEAIFVEDAPPDAVYIIDSGDVELTRGEASLGKVEAGKFIGELGVLSGQPRTLGAKAIGAVTALRVPVAVVRTVLEGEPGSTALAFLSRTVRYLRDANDRYADELLRKGKMQLVGEMARSIIHDFRNPLGTIDLAASLVAETHADAPTANAMRSIRRQIDRMAGMLQDLLDFGAGEVVLEMQSTRVDALLDEFREASSSRLRHAGVKLKLSAEPFIAVMDDRRILRVLENLLMNSIQALAGKAGTVSVEAHARDGRIELSLADDGPGVPPEIRETLFLPFVSHGRGRKSGLGLSVAQRVVESHGGSIKAESRPEGGARFVISLPLISGGQEGRLLGDAPLKREGPRPDPV